MVRIADIPEVDRAHLLAKACPTLPGKPWVTPPPVESARVALITTAGIGLRAEDAFAFGDLTWRVIPDDVDHGDIVMTHSSVNYDRSGFQADLNVVFPLDRLHEQVADGRIGAAASYHYSFMGALNEPGAYEESARDVAKLLRDDGVDIAVMSPV